MAGVVQQAADVVKDKLGLSGPDEPSKKTQAEQGAKDDLGLGERAYPAPAEEHPGTEPATLAAADNAGVETQAAVADETVAAAARKGQAATTQTGAMAPRADDGDTAEGTAVDDSTRESTDAAAPATPNTHAATGTQHRDDTRLQPNAGQPEIDQVKSGDAQSGGAQSGGAQTGGEPAINIDLHKDVLERQEHAGKIFHLEPVMPGGGAVVHGMVPAAILMHTAENTKRTGGSPRDATAGVPEYGEGERYGLEDKTGILEPSVPGAPATAAMAEAVGAAQELPDDTAAHTQRVADEV